MYGLDFRTGGGDYNLMVSDPQEQADLVVKGDCEAAIALPAGYFVEPRSHRQAQDPRLRRQRARQSKRCSSDRVVQGTGHPMI